MQLGVQSVTCYYVYIYIVIEAQVVKNLPINIRDSGDMGLIPMWERFSGEGNDNPLQYSIQGQRRLAGYTPERLQRIRHS